MLPDLIGYKLKKTLSIFDSMGIKDVKVNKTTAPKDYEQPITMESRVIRVTANTDNKINILVCN